MQILSLKWIEVNGNMILDSAKTIDVSEKSAEINLRVHAKSQYPKYVPMSDINRYMDKVIETPKTDVVSSPVITETPQKEKPVKEKSAKLEKPIFKTVEEKQAYGAAQKASERVTE